LFCSYAIGDWTNGTPPFPYEYERYNEKYNAKGLVVNDEQYKLYREIIEMALSGMSPNKIALNLNHRGILTKKGNYWSNVIIQRLLIDETHLGKIISNKTQGDGHKNKKPNAKKVKSLPKDEWIEVENCHEPVKTQEEHDIISNMIASRNIVPHRARKQTHAFSGIVRCGKCGHCMTFGKNTSHKDTMMLKPCWYKDRLGNICRNGGVVLSTFEDIIFSEIKKFKDNFEIESAELSKVNVNVLQKSIEEKETALKKFQNAIDVVNDSYDLGDYSREEWLTRKKKWEDKVNATRNEMYELKKQLNSIPEISSEIRQQSLEDFFNNITATTTSEERNNLFKTIIESIIWLKDGNDISVKINYK